MQKTNKQTLGCNGHKIEKPDFSLLQQLIDTLYKTLMAIPLK